MVEGFPVPFGRYTLLKKLGEGGMGDVFLAHDELLETHVAVKVPKFESSQDVDDVIARFYREARAMARIPHHAHICPVRDVGEFQGRHFLVMSHINGVSLSEIPKPLSIPHATQLVATIADAMQVAHDHHVIHRDLKPANIFILRDGSPMVMDFGLARRGDTDDSVTTTIGRIVGTPAFMSIEQIEGKRENVGPQSDVYSLGVLFYELLSGVLPFQGSVFTVIGQILGGDITPVARHNTDIAPELEAICMKAMARAQADRFASMAEFASAIRQYSYAHGIGGSSAAQSSGSNPQLPVPTAFVRPEELFNDNQQTIISEAGDTDYQQLLLPAPEPESINALPVADAD